MTARTMAKTARTMAKTATADDFQTILDRFVDKAGCMHSQRSATTYWQQLKQFGALTEVQRNALSLAWAHFQMGEGRRELDAVRKRIVDGKL